MYFKQITKKEHLDIKKLYFESILSIDERIYSTEQKNAWASQAWDNKNFDLSLTKGKGWYVYDRKNIIAFSSRYPDNRIALLYCKGNSQRKGYGTKLLNKLENDAQREGLLSLLTEASLLSYKLFLKNKWEIIRKEKIIIKNIIFERYKMKKNFNL